MRGPLIPVAGEAQGSHHSDSYTSFFESLFRTMGAWKLISRATLYQIGPFLYRAALIQL